MFYIAIKHDRHLRTRGNVEILHSSGVSTQNNKRRPFYVLYSDKTWVFDQSEGAQGPVYIIKADKPRGFW